ncbi:hypothetical protein HMPREF9103_01906 [Lentilactobacillus parafarraginis F0439]|uniref:Uncharacterized protein n=1 Tax=Lentilactobacillus parafarraginis F0439 TaxID=797515 RepID=G9ZQ99_9LACO|nr:hypothetical protein HMPREF9103_01906 [Lentilactobacillus parafarraginis F0439]
MKNFTQCNRPTTFFNYLVPRYGKSASPTINLTKKKDPDNIQILSQLVN